MNISVDVGYGYTKAVSDAGARVSFPSATAPAAVDYLTDGVFKRRFDYTVRITDRRGSVDRQVGDAAIRSNACRMFIARKEKPSDMHDVLLLTAAYLVSDNGMDASLAIGLPLSYYRTQKDTLKERLEDLNVWVSVNGGKEKYVRFKNVSVFPQGTGALLALNAPIPERGLIALLDIGTYTTDYLLFEVQGGVPTPIVEACGSSDTGIFLAHRAVAQEYEKATGTALSLNRYQEVFESVLNGVPVLHWGREINLTPAWLKVRKQVAEAVVGGAVAAWDEQIERLAMTAFAGGGSLVFFDVLSGMFPHPILVEEGYYANAVGFLKMISGT